MVGEFYDVRLLSTEYVTLLQTGIILTDTHGCLPASWLPFDPRRHERQGLLPRGAFSPLTPGFPRVRGSVL